MSRRPKGIEAMYYLPWVLLVMASLWVSLAAFFWGLKSGQFADQTRARYLPLRDECLSPGLKNPSKPSPEVYLLFGILGLGCLVLAFTLFLALSRHP
jgi:cbb3-type cytochrome oxidase maturation protein